MTGAERIASQVQRALRWVVLTPLFVFACGSDQSSSSNSKPPTGSPWTTTTHPFDPTCAKCTKLGSGALAHAGDATFYLDTETDDPPAQWGRCLLSVIQCIDEGKEIAACVQAGACPEVCKAEFAKRRKAAGGDDPEVEAMDGTFFDDGAPCVAPEEQVTP